MARRSSRRRWMTPARFATSSARVATVSEAGGHALAGLYFARAGIVYRKPCFRGEGYRRLAWFRGEAPLVIAGAFVKADDPPHARPAVAVELTVAQRDGATSRRAG